MNKTQWIWWGLQPLNWYVRMWPRESGIATFLWFSVGLCGLEIRVWHSEKVQERLISERVAND